MFPLYVQTKAANLLCLGHLKVAPFQGSDVKAASYPLVFFLKSYQSDKIALDL